MCVTTTWGDVWDPIPMFPSRLLGSCSPRSGQQKTSLAQLKGA